MRTHILLAALAAVATACGREHLSPAFGRANREAFGAQTARVEGRRAPPPSMALDAQEADVIGKGYVRSLAGKQARAEPPPILMVDQQAPNGGPQRLAPSVPKE